MPCAAVIFTSRCSTFVGSSLPIGGGVIRQRPLSSWSLAISRPLSSKVIETHEPSCVAGHGEQPLDLKAGAASETRRRDACRDARLGEHVAPRPIAERGDLLDRVPGRGLRLVGVLPRRIADDIAVEPSWLRRASLAQKAAMPPLFSTWATSTLLPGRTCFCMSISTGDCQSGHSPTGWPLTGGRRSCRSSP